MPSIWPIVGARRAVLQPPWSRKPIFEAVLTATTEPTRGLGPAVFTRPSAATIEDFQDDDIAYPVFSADLTTSTYVTTYGAGPALFSRASSATIQDHTAMLKHCKVGEARFWGSRRVENLVPSSESWSGWVAHDAPTSTPTGQIVFRASANNGVKAAAFVPGNIVATRVFRVRARVSAPSPITFKFQISQPGIADHPGSGAISVGTTERVVSDLITVATGGGVSGLDLYILNGSGEAGTLNISEVQCEEVSGQSNVNPSEYVSVGVLAAPYHGAHVDGVKYFNTLNGNTVIGNIVVEDTGAAIPANTMRGVWIEGEITNMFHRSEDLSHAAWNETVGVTRTANAAVGPDGRMTATRLNEVALNTYHYSSQQMATVIGTKYTTQYALKRGSRAWAWAGWYDTAANASAFWNFDTKTFGTVSGVTARYLGELAGGYDLISLTWTASTTLHYVRCGLSDGDTSISYLGDAAQFMYVGFTQMEANDAASTYIPTPVSAAVTRSHDSLAYPKANVPEGAFTIYCQFYRPLEWNLTGADPGMAPLTIGSYATANHVAIGGYIGNGVTLLGAIPGVWDLNFGHDPQPYDQINELAAVLRNDLKSWDLFSNGISYPGSTPAAKTGSWSGSYLGVGAPNGGAPSANQKLGVKNLKIFRRPLSLAELNAIQ